MEAPGRRFAFGLYEADPRSGELRKSGMKLRIQEQPFQILVELLEHPNEVVTRDELRQKLWPADTFVDFDHGLNTAINKLREVLGDTANNPRFVETLARRGYRFIAPVKVIGGDVASAGAAGCGSAQNGSQTHPHTNETTVATQSPAAQTSPPDVLLNDVPAGIVPALEDTPAEEEYLPAPSRGISRTLFALAQIMYLIFYGVALVNFDQLPLLMGNVLGGKVESFVEPVVLVTATVGIALRLYLLTAVLFDFKPLGAKFKRLYPFVLPLDQLWALAPFLLVSRIGIGAAFAACAALLYLPFSERTLVKMAYKWPN